MPLEWKNEHNFLVWLTTKEHENAIKFIVSVTEGLDSLNWWVQRTYRCSWEFSGGKKDCGTKTQCDCKIPLMKTGCQSHLIIKQYPGTEVIHGKYDDHHNHELGDENLCFLKLSHDIRSMVMDMTHEGTDPKVIVSDKWNILIY